MCDWVWLRLLHRPTHSLEHRPKGKLSLCWLFQVLAHIGQVTYRLQLPEGTRLHDVFHVGLLKPLKVDPPSTPPPVPPVFDDLLAACSRRPEHVLCGATLAPFACRVARPAPFACLISRTFSASQQCFFLTIN